MQSSFGPNRRVVLGGLAGLLSLRVARAGAADRRGRCPAGRSFALLERRAGQGGHH